MDLRIVVMPGDGIGQEVMDAAIAVLERVEARIGGFRLRFEHHHGGAAYWRDHGRDLAPGAFEAARAADAILFGAMGLPEVRKPDGTEVAPHLVMRAAFELFASLRPVHCLPGMTGTLADPRAADIDLVIVREASEGLFASLGKGVVEDDRVARDTLVITRATSEKLFDLAFRLAERRKKRGRPGRVTCVDKANVFVSFAFFRKIFDERARLFPDIGADHHYVDATALDLVRKPWAFDVLVMENMFGDILSDLAAGLVGGMGMAPSAELGLDHGLFQPAHGSAPDIAGQDEANPSAMILSAAMMLDWLADRHDSQPMRTAAGAIEDAVARGFAERRLRPIELGGDQGTSAFTRELLELLDAPPATVRAPDRDPR